MKRGGVNTRQGGFTKREHGFTLIEVLTAVTILGVALFILLASQWTSLNIHAVMNEEVTLGELVQTVAGKAEIGVQTGLLSDGGDFGTRYPDYTWTYDATLSGDAESTETQLYDVQITVQGPETEKQVNFYVYNNNPDNKGDDGLFEKPGQGGNPNRPNRNNPPRQRR